MAYNPALTERVRTLLEDTPNVEERCSGVSASRLMASCSAALASMTTINGCGHRYFTGAIEK